MDETSWHDAISKYPVDCLVRSGIPERPNLFRIARFPNSELASSNTLAWLLDPAGNHGLGTLALEALLARIRRDDAVCDDALVDTEVVTGKGNRIDVLVLLPDLAIAIENKVLSGLNNDLADYRDAAQEQNGTEAVVVVFRPRHQDDFGRYRDDGLKPGENLFEVLYDKLFHEIFDRLDGRILDADPRGVDLLMQYIDNYSPERKKAAMQEYEQTIARFSERTRGIEAQITAFCRDLNLYAELANHKLDDLHAAIRGRIEEGLLGTTDGTDVTVAKTWNWPDRKYFAEPSRRQVMFHAMIFHLEGHEDVAIELFANTYPDYHDVCYDPERMSAHPGSFDMLGYKAYRYCPGDTKKQAKRNVVGSEQGNDFYHVFEDARLSDPVEQLCETIGNHYRDILASAWNVPLAWREQ